MILAARRSTTKTPPTARPHNTAPIAFLIDLLTLLSSRPQSPLPSIDRYPFFLQYFRQHKRIFRGLGNPAASVRILAATVVVEERKSLFRFACNRAQRARPFAELALGVKVVKSLGCALSADVPGRGVASVEADVCRRARQGDDRGHEVLRLGLGRVNDYVGRSQAFEEREGVRAVVLVEPAAVAELDEHVMSLESLAGPFEVRQRGITVNDVRRELEQDPTELAGRTQGFEPGEEPLEHLGAKLPRRPVHPPTLISLDGISEVGRKLLGLDGVACHDPERLYVKDEPLRSPLGPACSQLGFGQAVVGGVHLDRVEMLGVVPKTRFRALYLARVPVLYERLVGPGARSDADRSRHARSLRIARGRAERLRARIRSPGTRDRPRAVRP